MSKIISFFKALSFLVALIKRLIKEYSKRLLNQKVKERADSEEDEIDKAFSNRNESALSGLRDGRPDETQD